MADGEITIKPVFDTSDIKSSAQQVSNALKSVLDSGALSKQGAKGDVLANSIKKTTNNIDAMLQKLQKVEQTRVVTPQFKDLVKQFQAAQDKVDGMRAKLQEMEQLGFPVTSAYQKMKDDLAQAEQYAGGLKEKIDSLRDSGEGFDTSSAQKLEGQLQNLVTQGELYKKKADDMTKSTQKTNKAFDGLKQTCTTVKGRLAEVGAIFGRIFQGGGSAVAGIGNLVKKVALLSIGFYGLRSAVQKFKQYASEGLKALAQQIPSVNAQLSSVKTNLATLKGAVGAAVQPLITALLPVINAVISKLVEAVNIAGQFIALLTGQKFVYKAAGTQQTFADAVGGANKKVDDQTKKLKKEEKQAKDTEKALEGYLSPIDEINKYRQDDTIDDLFPDDDDLDDLGDKLNDALNGGGGGGGGIATFEKGEIEGWIKDFWQKIKDTWNTTADFTWLGYDISKKLTDSLNKIEWNEIQETSAKLGKAIATGLNGFFSNTELGTTLGHTFAQLFNTGGAFVSAFASNFKGEPVGQRIQEGIVTFLNETKWGQMAKAASNLMGEFFMAVKGFLQNPSETLTSVIQAITDAIQGFKSGQFANGATEMIKALEDAIHYALTDEDFGKMFWDMVLEVIGISVNHDNFFVQTADIFKDGIGDIMDVFNDETSSSVAKFDIFSADYWKILWNDGLDAAEAAARGEWDYRKQSWQEYCKNEGKFVMNGVSLGLDESVPLVKDAAGKDVVLTITEVVEDGFEIHSPSRLAFRWGQFITEGLCNGLKDTIPSVLSTLETMKTNITAIFDRLSTSIKRPINAIISCVESMVNFMVEGINSAISALNSLSFSVPSWVPGIGGGSFNLSIPTIPTVSLPRLAQGAVIPANKEFLAVLGDQKQGTNIEAPLDTIVEAFNIANRNNGGGRTEINFLLPNRQQLAQYVIEGGRVLQTSRGTNPFQLA